MTTTSFVPHAISQVALKPSITLVISPQEHFNGVQQALESIYEHTTVPFELVYVDAGSPRRVQRYLAKAAVKYNFTLLRCDRFLKPNQSRNLGLSQVTTEYVVFITNDIHVSSGWLSRLWQCAQETDAAVVSPLNCDSHPLPEAIELRYACKLAALTCLLVKRDVFDQIGYLDPKLLGEQADMDFCFNIHHIDEQIFCEPSASVTSVSQRPTHWSDWMYFMLRWSDAWELDSLMHFQKKWDLDVEDCLRQHYSKLGQHRHQTFLHPLLNRLAKDPVAPGLEQLAIDLERYLNQALVNRHARSNHDIVGNVIHTSTVATPVMASNHGLEQDGCRDTDDALVVLRT
ncbi:MAG: glycosyltransferase family 2 protein [Leptolyngbyaceae cyanobacterium MAG.088]|nr:glycosyltransferase family 2 protein [Leptolyngbyaceae cyanobacterium MAG.088]